MRNNYTPNDQAMLQMLGAALRQQRIERGFSQEKLAEIAGLNVTYVSDIERGKRNVAILNLTRLARAMNLSVSEILQGVL